MTHAFLLVAAGLLCGAAALAGTPDHLADWLVSDADKARLETVAAGAALLRAILMVDALLLWGAAAWIVRRGRVDQAGWRPLWSPDSQRSVGQSSDRIGWLLALSIVVAALLRLPGLDSDLWIDEVFSLVDFFRHAPGDIVTDFHTDNQHMLYSLSAHASWSLFGESPWALRLPALLAGLASLWATFRFARHAIGDREAVFATLLLALSYHHVWFSQNARGYTFLLLGTVLSTDLLLRGLETGRARFWIGHAATLSLSAWAHLTIVFVGATHALVVLYLWRRVGYRDERVWLPIGALALSAWGVVHLYALVIPQMLDYFVLPGAGSTTAAVDWSKPIWLVTETLRHLGVGLALGWVGVALGIGVVSWGILRLTRRDAMVSALMLLPAVIGGLTMMALGRSLWPRFFFNELAFAAIMAMSGALAVGDWGAARLAPRRSAQALALIPALALCLASAASLPRAYRLPKQDYTGARDFVRERLDPGDRVVGLHLAGTIYDRYYAPEWLEADDIEQLRAHMRPNGRTWVVYTLPGYLRSAQPDLMDLLEEQFEPIEEFWGTLGDGVIVVRRSRGDPCTNRGGDGCP